MPNNDKIYQAFIGELGESFQKKTIRRISWIIAQVGNDDSILDIGCSQGIVSILLAQKGKQVLGIDIQSENIEFAQKILTKDFSNLQNNINFACIDFFKYKATKKVKCIIIAQVLEHLEDPELFLSLTREHLQKNGKLVVTVPFGVANHPDHLSTFYMGSLYNLVTKYYDITHIEFLGRWMGLVAYSKGSGHQIFELNEDAIRREEINFMEIDKELVDKITKLKKINNNRIKIIGDYRKENQEYRRISQMIVKLKSTWYGKIAYKLFTLLSKNKND